MRKLLMFFVMMLLAVGLAACGGEQSSSGESSDATPDTDSEENDTNEGEGEATGDADFPEMKLAIGHSIADNEESHYHFAVLHFKEAIEEATGGKVTLEIHPNGTLGGEREMVEAVQLGTLDMVITSSGPVGNFADKSNALDFPFLFKDRHHAYKVLDGEIGDEINEELDAVGIKVLAWAENGFRNMTTNTAPIVSPDDIKGQKLRTMENQVHLAAFEAYGAAPTPMAFPELFSALQQGVVDGQENPLAVIIPNNFYEVQKYLTLSEHIYSPAPFLMNKDLFESFSPELQEIFVTAAEEMRDAQREFIYNLDDQFIQKAKDEGMEIITQDEFDYDAFFEATQKVYEQYEDQYGEIHEKIMAIE